jgi:hypothetical protein
VHHCFNSKNDVDKGLDAIFSHIVGQALPYGEGTLGGGGQELDVGFGLLANMQWNVVAIVISHY